MKKILLVEKDVRLLQQRTEIIQDCGYSVYATANYEQAIFWSEHHLFQLMIIVADNQPINGLELVDVLNHNTKQQFALKYLLSDSLSHSQKQDALRLGISKWMPYSNLNPDFLIEMIALGIGEGVRTPCQID